MIEDDHPVTSMEQEATNIELSQEDVMEHDGTNILLSHHLFPNHNSTTKITNTTTQVTVKAHGPLVGLFGRGSHG